MTSIAIAVPSGKFPPTGQVHQLAGANIHNAYYGTGAAGNGSLSAAIALGKRRRRIRFMVRIVLAVGSTITDVKIEIKQRYNDGTVAGAFTVTPSSLDDAAGAVQPKGNTLETEHDFSGLAAGGGGATFDRYFLLDPDEALNEIALDVHADQAGIVGDSITIYASRGV